MIPFLRLLIFSALIVGISTSRGAEVRLGVAHTGTEAAVQLSGEAGTEYLLEAAAGSAENWEPVTSFVLTGENQLWRQAAANGGSRFFRARTVTEADRMEAPNFRLIDQDGKSRELHYYESLTTVKAIVVVFAEGNYGAFAPKIAALKGNPQFQNSVLFWTVETGTENSRTNILREALAAGITWPVFHDPLQLVTHKYGARFNGEVFVVSRAGMQVVYRGKIDDTGGPGPAANPYLAMALTNAVQFEQVMTTRMEPEQNRITRAERQVADYSTVIAPLLQRRCVTCHSPDNIAPFALTSYEAVVEHSPRMKHEVLAGNMPPWHADPLHGKFRNDISLSPTEKAQLMDWLEAGLPRGTGPDPLTDPPPPRPKWPAELGEPDQIVRVPRQTVAASGTIAYRYIYANATNTVDRWLKAAVVLPSNPRVVHHYITWEGHLNFGLNGLASYAPGRTEGAYPEGTGMLLKANMPMTFNLHYTATGQLEVDEPELGLWYADAPPARPLKTIPVLNSSFTFGQMSIPPRDPEFQMSATTTFSRRSLLRSFNPHMHFRGLRMRFELTTPTGAKQVLLSVPKYDFHWQTIYYPEQPIDVPANSTVTVIGAFDNSAQNHHNPNPNIAVKWGEQSWDEMFIGYIEYTDY